MRLRIAEDLSLPIEAVTEKSAFLGRTGSGKTYAAQKLAEEMHRVGAQFVALDPVGKWWSLRLSADGKTPALPIPVFGGLHGDIPLESGAGKLMADVVVDRGISAVIDVSQFESDTQKARFMTEFGNRFFFRKKAAPSAVHLFIEEAQEFVPQNPQRDEAIMLHAWTRIQKLGRNFGIGSSLISQRPQEVNKKVLNLTELLFVFQLTGTHERESVAKWIEDKGLDEDIAAELPKLAQGRPHVWSPAWLQISKVISIGRKHTYDASKTPTVGHRQDVKELTPIDLARLQKDMASTIERAKQDDPRELRREIADLRRQLLAKADRSSMKAEKKSAIVEVPVIRPRELKTLQKSAAYLDTVWSRFEAAGQAVRKEAEHLREIMTQRLGGLRTTQDLPPVSVKIWPKAPVEVYRRRIDGADSGTALPRGERAILIAMAQHRGGVSREQLTVLTGYRRSSRDAYLQRLRERGFVEAAGDRLFANDGALAVLGNTFEPLPVGATLRTYWLDRLPVGEREILRVVVGAYPESVERDRLSTLTQYKRSSRDAYLQRLKARELVLSDGQGGIRASDALF